MLYTHKTDQVLTELAAKAIGLTGYQWCNTSKHMYTYAGNAIRIFAPLQDNDDAFMLATKLGFTVEFPKYKGFGSTCGKHTVFRDDQEEQTRRAIVLEAADKASVY